MTVAKAENQIFDVAKPGKATPSPTSRPVIVGHGPMLKDPMVSQQSQTEEPSSAPEPGQKLAAETHKTLTPPSETSSPSETTDVAEPETAPPASGPTDAEIRETEKRQNESAVVEAVANQAAKKKSGKSTPEDIARQNELEKLIEDKTYFVPIGQVKRRHHKHVFWTIFILLILVLAGGYVAIDLDMLDVGIKLPFHILKK